MGKFAATALLLFCFVVLPCSCAKGEQAVKLNQTQRELADQFFNNRDQWEKAGSEYCFSMRIYKTSDGAEVDCTYSDTPMQRPTTAAKWKSSAFIGIGDGVQTLAGGGSFKYLVTRDSFTNGGVNSTPFGMADGRTSLGGVSYYFNDNDSDKQKSVEQLFSYYK